MPPAFRKLSLPIAFDMPDHAARMERLGVGVQISRKHFGGKSLAHALRRILDEPGYRAKAQEVSRGMNCRKAVAAAYNVIEETFRRAQKKSQIAGADPFPTPSKNAESMR